MDTQKLIQKYINIIGTPNPASGGAISRLQKERIVNLQASLLNPSLKRDVRTNAVYVRLRDQEWLDLTSPTNCLRFSTIVEKYPEIWVEI